MIKLFWNYFLKNGSYEDCYVMFTRSKKVIDIYTKRPWYSGRTHYLGARVYILLSCENYMTFQEIPWPKSASVLIGSFQMAQNLDVAQDWKM